MGKNARTFGQDLMRGEHVVGGSKQTASLKSGLTYKTTTHPYRGGEGGDASQTGTSIFDPVLCELVYRWFSPPGGVVLDPFAGGSVRGIVAGRLGRSYVGVDLRPEQVQANRDQWAAIAAGDQVDDGTALISVTVSAKMARLPFHGCEPDYIATTCHAACCQSTTSPTGTMITIHPTEAEAIEDRGGVIADGLLQPRPGERRCPFKTDAHLCGLHETPDKPFGCIASPFTLNARGTLIVRNRYKLLKCYNDGPKLPAYVAFRASLERIFGADEAARISAHLEAGGGDIVAEMPAAAYRMLTDNDAIKRGGGSGGAMGPAIDPAWHVGDSRDIGKICRGTKADLIFSCPPYADLEVYSDDPRDISTLGYDEFLEAYRAIIAGAAKLLKPDRFACFVVGDVRDKAGLYRGFPRHTVDAFEAAGLRLYNEAVLVTAAGSLPIRVGKQFTASRKLGKTHQNVLVFVKGDPVKATKALGLCDFGTGEDDAEEGAPAGVA